MKTKSKFLFLAGSARKDSVNKKLAHNAYEIAKELGADATFIDLKDYPLPIYDGDLEESEGMPENALKLKTLFIENNGIFIACPEYNSSFTPLLKNVVDWVSRTNEKNEGMLKAYKDKIVALAAASPSNFGGQRCIDALKIMFNNIGVKIVPKTVAIPNAYDKFNKDGVLKDKEKHKELTEMVKDFIT